MKREGEKAKGSRGEKGQGAGRSRRKAAPLFYFYSGGVSPSLAFERRRNLRRLETAATALSATAAGEWDEAAEAAEFAATEAECDEDAIPDGAVPRRFLNGQRNRRNRTQ